MKKKTKEHNYERIVKHKSTKSRQDALTRKYNKELKRAGGDVDKMRPLSSFGTGHY